MTSNRTSSVSRDDSRRRSGKERLKRASAALVPTTVWGRSRSERSVVFCYHSIHPKRTFASATPELFRRHLSWLVEHCDLIQLGEIFAPRGTADSRPRVALTFDDGYEDNYTHAFPILEAYSAPATFFVTAGLVARDAAVISRFCALRGCSVDDVAPLQWSQIGEMRAAGYGFGAHTYSHANLAALPAAAAADEVRRSKYMLEERLNESLTAMAYPFGKPRRHFSDGTVRIVQEAGYTTAAAVLFRSVRPTDSPLAIPRFFVTRDDIDTLQAKVLGSWDLVGLWQEKAPMPIARILSPRDFATEA